MATVLWDRDKAAIKCLPCQGFQYRLLAFLDKTDTQHTIGCLTHGFIKKHCKVTDSEIKKANQLMY